MKKEDLFEAMNGIDEKDIENSEIKTPGAGRLGAMKVLAACACMVIVIGAVYNLGSNKKSPENEDMMQQAESAEEAKSVDGADGEMSGLANPMEETAIDGILTEWGAKLEIPQGATDIQEFVIHGEHDLLERQFTYHKVRYTARVQQADAFTDISGMNYTWTSEKEVTVGQTPAKFYYYLGGDEEPSAAVCLWYDSSAKLMYSLSMTGEEEDVDQLLPVAELMQ